MSEDFLSPEMEWEGLVHTDRLHSTKVPTPLWPGPRGGKGGVPQGTYPPSRYLPPWPGPTEGTPRYLTPCQGTYPHGQVRWGVRGYSKVPTPTRVPQGTYPLVKVPTPPVARFDGGEGVP